MSNSALSYTVASVSSHDGTIIGYRQLGSGPGVIIWHGGMQASQGYMRLATALADTFTVYVPDRRGRGLSGPHGEQYSMAKECHDVEALLSQSGAQFLFGHSSGGLVALQAAFTLPAIRKVAVYEPPLSLSSLIFTMPWTARFEREIARGHMASALITVGKGLTISRTIALLPRWLLLPLITFLLHRDRQTLKPNDVAIEALIPTQQFDMLLVEEMDGSLDRFAKLESDVLLLGGNKSPAFLRDALDALEKTLPHVERVDYHSLRHDAPNETPERLVSDLRTFFGPSIL